MPPKKRQRLSPAEEATSSAATPADPVKQQSEPHTPDLVNDPWTDEQEAALFKGLIRWKPVGMHKHFRMLSLANYMYSHGHEAEHTRAEGIWAKLNSLYNLKTLDEREDTYGDNLFRESPSSTPSSNESSSQPPPNYPFQLPEDSDISALIYDKRLAVEPPSSPPVVKHQLSKSGTERVLAESYNFTDTEEYCPSPASTPVNTPKARRGSTGKGKAPKEAGRKVSKLKEDGATKAGARGRGKKEEEDVEEEGGDEDEEEDEDSEEDERSDAEEAESERGTPKTRGAGRGRGRGRGPGRGRGGRRR